MQNIQVDNQLADAQMPVVLYLTPTLKTDASCHLPAIHFTSYKSNRRSGEADSNAEIYKHLMVTVRNVTLNLEEVLIFKALRFAGIMRSDEELEKIDESAYEAQRGALIASTTTAKRYYFGTLKLSLNQVGQQNKTCSIVFRYILKIAVVHLYYSRFNAVYCAESATTCRHVQKCMHRFNVMK